MFEEYYATVKYLETLARPFGGAADPTVYLKRMQHFLDMVGNPEKDLRVVHVTGTAGKGSVSKLIQSMLVLAGHKTGLFTSPFVTTTIEKIQVDDLYISPDEFVSITTWLKPFIEKATHGPYGAPTYFEAIFAIALVYFKRSGCTWAVLEVGLGGRYDATNIVTSPEVTVITNINYDHTNILGKTLKKIAYDKAGIIKKGSVFFTTETRPGLLTFFKNVCEEVGATFNAVKAHKHLFDQNNSALAQAVAQYLKIDDTIIQKAVHSFQMQARFEVMQEKPLVIIDGAHNPVKIKSVIERIYTLKKEKNKTAKVSALVAFSEDKDVDNMVKSLGKFVDKFWITRYETSLRNAMDPEKIQKSINHWCPDQSALVVENTNTAFEEAKKKSSVNDILIITGSFYLAGAVRRQYFPEEYVLTHRKSFK